MAVQKAYERLQLGGQGGQGPQAWRLLLLLKVLLCCTKHVSQLNAAGMPGRCKSDPEVYQKLGHVHLASIQLVHRPTLLCVLYPCTGSLA